MRFSQFQEKPTPGCEVKGRKHLHFAEKTCLRLRKCIFKIFEIFDGLKFPKEMFKAPQSFSLPFLFG